MHTKSEIEMEIEVMPANEGDCMLITIEKEDIQIVMRKIRIGRMSYKRGHVL